MESCGCIYVGVDEFEETISEARTFRAFVERKCGECGRILEKGEAYEYWVSEFDGCVSAHITCLDCQSIRDVFFCGEWFWGMIIEYLDNHIVDLEGHISSECILALTPRAREHVFDAIEEVWKEIELDEEVGYTK